DRGAVVIVVAGVPSVRPDVEPSDGLLVLPEHEGRAVAGPGQGRRVNETGGTPGHGGAFVRLERRHQRPATFSARSGSARSGSARAWRPGRIRRMSRYISQPSLKVYLSYRFNEKTSTIA